MNRRQNTLTRAENIIQFSFPRDHGKHGEFQTEWWYLSGCLECSDGGSWAYHFTIFRRAFSSWSHLSLIALAMASRKVRESSLFQRFFSGLLENSKLRRIPVDGYVGHFSLTNINERQFVFFERGGTSILNVAGAEDSQLNVWVKTWKLFHDSGGFRLKADRNEFGIDLILTQSKPHVLNGSHGLSQKAQGLGEASYHYSIPALKSSGTINWKGKRHHVTGSSFMDREFGTSILPKSVRGWEWFGIALNNDHQVMISVIRNNDWTMAITSSGVIINPDASWISFTASDMIIQVLETWTSKVTGAAYPVHWSVKLPKLQIELNILALIKEHELVTATSTTINYWEGPVNVTGLMSGNIISGHGHVELVGYSESAGGKF